MPVIEIENRNPGGVTEMRTGLDWTDPLPLGLDSCVHSSSAVVPVGRSRITSSSSRQLGNGIRSAKMAERENSIAGPRWKWSWGGVRKRDGGYSVLLLLFLLFNLNWIQYWD